MMADHFIHSFWEFLETGVSPYHVTKEILEQCLDSGFVQLSMKELWNIEAGGRYVVNIYDSAAIAFIIPDQISTDSKFRIAAAHTDFPCLRIKAAPELSKDGYLQLNTEVYGGAIYPSWMDRPLSIAGKVALKSKNAWQPEVKLLDFGRPVLTIPNLAIHMNRKINEGIALNPQTDLLPLAGTSEDDDNENFLISAMAEELGITPEDILNYDLRIYNTELPTFVGLNSEFLSAPRLDNLTSVWSILKAITTYPDEEADSSSQTNDICVAAFFDHEEIGSRSKQGAGSMLLRDTLERIAEAFDYGRKEFHSMLYKSIFLSADVAHALHPNHPNKNDLTSKPVLNGGFCIKESGSQAYLTDPEVMAILHQICHKKEIPIQHFINRSDERGGSTLGAIASSYLPIRGADIGIPILAMHSARELMGCRDLKAFYSLLNNFYHYL